MGASVRLDTENWPQVIADIRGTGMMKKAVARHAGISPNTLGNYESASVPEPPYSVGKKLLELHARVVVKR